MTRRLRVAFVGTYDRAPHARNAIVIEALRAAGVDVVEHHVPLWRDTDAKIAAARAAPRDAVRLARRVACAWRALDARLRQAPACDVVWVGATGLLDVPVACRWARRLDVPLIFDPLVSLGETARDRGLAGAGSGRLALFDRLEARLLRWPDLVAVDTAAHAAAWADEVGLPAWRTFVLAVGAPRLFRDRTPPYAPGDGRPVRVVYFGQYIPLHGVDVMLAAADRLRGRAIEFEFIGDGQMRAAAEAMADRLGLAQVRFVPRWLTPEALIDDHIASADICLGAFGDRPKTARVVPYKVYASLAAGRAVVTGDTPALRERLVPGIDVATVPLGDPVALARMLADLADDPARRAALAAAGQAAFERLFSPERLGAELRSRLGDAVAAHAAQRRGVGPRQRWRTAHLAGLVANSLPPGPDGGPGPTVLDVGCGDGALSLALGRARPAFGGSVLAFDTRLDRARAARARVRWSDRPAATAVFVADAAAIPLPSASVAAAASGEVLEHLADDAAAAREVARVLAPGGSLAVTVPAGADRYGAADRAAGHRRRYDAASLDRLLAEAGLCRERLAGWGFPFGRVYDRLVQRPALALAGRRARRPARWIRAAAGWGWLDAVWRGLFAVDGRLAAWAGRRGRPLPGSGLDAVARRPDGPGRGSPRPG